MLNRRSATTLFERNFLRRTGPFEDSAELRFPKELFIEWKAVPVSQLFRDRHQSSHEKRIENESADD